MGSGVTYIGYYAFYSCPSLASITFSGLVAPTTVGIGWIGSTSEGVRGHAYAASNLPSPGGVFNDLTMGTVLPAIGSPGLPQDLNATAGYAQVTLTW